MLSGTMVFAYQSIVSAPHSSLHVPPAPQHTHIPNTPQHTPTHSQRTISFLQHTLFPALTCTTLASHSPPHLPLRHNQHYAPCGPLSCGLTVSLYPRVDDRVGHPHPGPGHAPSAFTCHVGESTTANRTMKPLREWNIFYAIRRNLVL